MEPSTVFPDGPRFGAFLRAIPPSNRIGDYVHCASRVVNIVLKRLVAEFPNRSSGPLKQLIQECILISQGLPLPDRLAPRHTKEGTLDLTASTLFITHIESHGRLVQCARDAPRIILFGNGKLSIANAMAILLRTLHSLHAFWRQKKNLTPVDIQNYHALASRFGSLWRALGWKVSTWVHWVVRHSAALAALHQNFYLFSSIPTERRNVEFKMDVTHCYKGWKISRPHASRSGFAHVLNLSALDVGLLLYFARHRGRKRGPVDNDDESSG